MQPYDEKLQQDQQDDVQVDELFAEELPEQSDLATPAGTWGSVGCVGSVGTFSGTAGSGSSVSTGSSFG